MAPESDDAESVYDTASSNNSRLGLPVTTTHQRSGDHLDVPNASGYPERSMSFRSMSRTPSSKYRDSELVSQSHSHGENGPTIDEVLASNNGKPTQKGNKAIERLKSVDHRSISSDICVSPSWSRAAQKKREKKEQKKKMERERKELERKLKQEAKRKSRASSREPRRLQKRTPPVASSRASSTHSVFHRASTESSFVSFWSRRTSRANSINEQSQDETKKKSRRFSFGGDGSSKDDYLKKKLKLPNVWSRRSAKPEEPSTTEQLADSDSTALDDHRHSLHTVKKHTDLRASAKETTFELIGGGVQRDPEPGFVHLASHRKKSADGKNGNEHAPRRDSLPEGSPTPPRVVSNGGPRFPFHSNNNTESRRKFSPQTRSSAVATQAPSLGSRVITSTDPVNSLNKAKQRDRDHTSKDPASQSTQGIASRSSREIPESSKAPLAARKSPKQDSNRAVRSPRPSIFPTSPAESANAELKSQGHRDSPKIRQSNASPKPLNSFNGQDQLTLNNGGVSADEIKARPSAIPSSHTNSPGPEHSPLPSSYIRDANFRSSPLAGPPLVVQDSEKPRGAPGNEEQGQYTIEPVQNQTRRRRTSFQGYLESKGLSLPRFLGQGKKGKNDDNVDSGRPENNTGKKSSSNVLAAVTNQSEKSNSRVNTSSTSTTDASMPGNGINTARPHRTSNEIMQKLRATGDQRERLRKRAATIDLNSKRESMVAGQGKDGRSIDDKPLTKRDLQTTTPQISQILSSPRLPANTGKKIANGLSDDVPVASAGPSYSRHRGIKEYIPTTPSALSLHQAIGTSVKSPGATRTVGQQIAKMFVICCQCKHWHDMTSQAYTKLAFPNAAPPTDTIQKHPGTVAPPGALSSPLRTFAGSPLASPISSSTSLEVKEGKVPIRPGTGSTSASLNHSTICCWCWHQMAKTCCAGWTTIVTMHERHH